jgi:hypothetical protein
MKALYNTLTVITGLVIVGLLWSQYRAYQKRDDDAYNAQCPNPTGEYFDCVWWPRRGT